jgi:PKD repeat protein
MPNPGIGASGQMGIAAEVLPAPVLAGGPTAGGALTAGVYKYYVTALNANGETSVSNEITVTTAAGNLTAALTWGTVTGATGYKVYRTAAGGATGTELLLATLGVVLLYNDAAVGAPAGAFPTVNTATAPGTYVAPVKFFPFRSETLQYQQATVWRRPIRKSADIIGAVAGNVHTEGDIEMEALEDVVIHFLYATRNSIVKSNVGANYTYVCTPTAAAVPIRTLSITIERNGIVFGYTGCVVGNFKFGIDEGLCTFTCGIVGLDEAVQSLPVPTFTTTVPFGAGQYDVQIPTASSVYDVDTFEWTCENNAEPQFRLKNTGRGAQFVKFGERAMGLTAERDFMDRTDYDAFKALTSQTVTIVMSKGTNNKITLLTPVSIKDTYEVGLSGEGDLVRASIAYQMTIDGSGNSYTITVLTQENVL